MFVGSRPFTPDFRNAGSASDRPAGRRPLWFVLVQFGACLLAIGSAWTTAESIHSTIYSENWLIPWAFAGGFALLLLGGQLYILSRMSGVRVSDFISLALVAALSICFNFDIFFRYLDATNALVGFRQKAAVYYHDYLAQIHSAMSQELQRMDTELLDAETNLDAEMRGVGFRLVGRGPRARDYEEEIRRLDVAQKPRRQLLSDTQAELAPVKDNIYALGRASSVDEVRVLCSELNLKLSLLAQNVGLASPSVPTFQEIKGLTSIVVLVSNPSLTAYLCLFLAALVDLGALMVASIFGREKQAGGYGVGRSDMLSDL